MSTTMTADGRVFGSVVSANGGNTISSGYITTNTLVNVCQASGGAGTQPVSSHAPSAGSVVINDNNAVGNTLNYILQN